MKCTSAGASGKIAATLTMLRGAYRATGRVLAGEWPRTALIGREASGKTLGIVGFGAIGRAVALGMEAAAFDPMLPPMTPRGARRGSAASTISGRCSAPATW